VGKGVEAVLVENRNAMRSDIHRARFLCGLGERSQLAAIGREYDDTLIPGPDTQRLIIDKGRLGHAVRLDGETVLQQVAGQRSGKAGLLELVDFEFFILVVEYGKHAPGVDRQVTDVAKLGARLSERTKLREDLEIAPVEDGNPALNGIADVQSTIQIRRHCAELGRIAEVLL